MNPTSNTVFSVKKEKPLGLLELIAIALGGMVGGGIFSILGVSVEQIGNATPVAIFLGGGLALLAAYSYVTLATYYKDEGATYSFFKRTYPDSPFIASVIGWYVIFGYISTLALYAFTFSSYTASILPSVDNHLAHKIIGGAVITVFAIINITSVKGMGRIEDFLVYTKIILLLIISVFFIQKSELNLSEFQFISSHDSFLAMFIVGSITFVAFEGFQLVIHAYSEADKPDKNVPRAIYISIVAATFLYIILATGAIMTIPKELIIKDKEFALASGATSILGSAGLFIVIFGALLATSSAISGTLFGASRLMAVIATDGYFPKILTKRRHGHIPHYAIILMSVLAYSIILFIGLETILEFGSITFIIVSFLMALANFKIRDKTSTNIWIALLSMVGLAIGGLLIFYYEYIHNPMQMYYILGIYILLTLAAWGYAKLSHQFETPQE